MTDSKNGSTKFLMLPSQGNGKSMPLISPKPFKDFAPTEFQEHVKTFYEERKKGRAPAKPKNPVFADGITLTRTKKGLVSIRVNKKKRPFPYLTEDEVTALAKGYGMTIAEVWNAFKAKGFMITKTKAEAEAVLAKIKEIPF